MRLTPSMTRSLAALLGLLMSATAIADGLIIAEPVRQQRQRDRPAQGRMPAQVPLEVTHHDVTVDISGTLAQTAVDQAFRNPRAMVLEGTYLFPVPSGASISQFSMDVNGSQMPGEVQEIEKATEVYESIIRRTEDPALVEYIGERLVSMRIFPINGHATKPVKITYSEVLKAHEGLVAYRYPLNTEKFAAGKIGRVSVEIRIRENYPIGNIYSPSHPISISRVDANTAVIRFEAKEVKPTRDFLLYYQKSETEVGVATLSYKPSQGDGYFAAIVSPHKLGATPEPKDIVFAVDTSHSMKDAGKMDHLRRALTHCINRLAPGDRFNIVNFGSAADSFDDRLVAVDDDARREANRHIAGLKPSGGTNISEALDVVAEIAANSGKDRRELMVILITDGKPTIGQQTAKAISEVANQIEGAKRIFCLGVGDEVDAALLDGLAREHRGTAHYIEAGDDLDNEARAFFDKVARPVLTHVKLTCQGGAEIYDIQPARLPDLFYGSQLVVLGRFRGAGKATLALTGSHKGQPMRFEYEVDFDRTAGDDGYIAHLYARRKVGRLLEQIRNGADNKDQLEERVVSLARRYGILTPYTAYLVLENEQMWRDRFTAKERGPKVHNPRSKPSRPHTAQSKVFAMTFNATMRLDAKRQLDKGEGRDGVIAARQIGELASETHLKADHLDSKTVVRHVGDKAFYRDGERWIDASVEDSDKVTEVAYLSKAYFALLKANRGLGRFLALGKQITVKTAKGQVIRVNHG